MDIYSGCKTALSIPLTSENFVIKKAINVKGVCYIPISLRLTKQQVCILYGLLFKNKSTDSVISDKDVLDIGFISKKRKNIYLFVL